MFFTKLIINNENAIEKEDDGSSVCVVGSLRSTISDNTESIENNDDESERTEALYEFLVQEGIPTLYEDEEGNEIEEDKYFIHPSGRGTHGVGKQYEWLGGDTLQPDTYDVYAQEELDSAARQYVENAVDVVSDVSMVSSLVGGGETAAAVGTGAAAGEAAAVGTGVAAGEAAAVGAGAAAAGDGRATLQEEADWLRSALRSCQLPTLLRNSPRLPRRTTARPLERRAITRPSVYPTLPSLISGSPLTTSGCSSAAAKSRTGKSRTLGRSARRPSRSTTTMRSASRRSASTR
jgi:hypothetical protein